MPKKKSTSSSSREIQYSDFLKSVKLIAIALDEVSAHLDRESYWRYSENKIALVRTIDASYKPNTVEGVHFNVLGSFEMKLAPKSGALEVLSIKCNYTAHFHSDAECYLSAAQKFAKSEAKIVLWPYFRQLVSDVSARMFIPPITVPLTLETT